MPRRTVSFFPGGYYHLYNRGAGRQSIFRVDENYRYLLELVKAALPDLQLTLIAYCLLPNHYHWLVRQDGEIPADLLAQRVFNRYGRRGTLFEDRYKAKPVRPGLAMAPDLWPYSNYLEWIGQRPGKLVDHDFIRATFGSGPAWRSRAGDVSSRASSPTSLARWIEGTKKGGRDLWISSSFCVVPPSRPTSG